MPDEAITICEGCREEIEPEAPDTVRAVEVHDVRAFGDTRSTVEGLGVYFHAQCIPSGSTRYRKQ